jgi:hypothetical protein
VAGVPFQSLFLKPLNRPLNNITALVQLLFSHDQWRRKADDVAVGVVDVTELVLGDFFNLKVAVGLISSSSSSSLMKMTGCFGCFGSCGSVICFK